MTDHQEKEMLEGLAGEYLSPNPGRVVDRKILAMIVDRVLPWVSGPEVLELGYGDEAWTEHLIQKLGHSHVVDASCALLKRAKERYGDKIHTYHHLFEDFEPARPFDTVIASFVLEHVLEPVEILRRARSWIKPDGCVIIVVPNADSFHRQLAVCMQLQKATDELGPTDLSIGHRRVYTVKKMEQDIAAAGLSVEEKRGFFTKFLPQSMMSGFSDELLEGFMRLSEHCPMENACSIAFKCVPLAGGHPSTKDRG